MSSVPSDCPGTTSENAGKANACEGCPNQKICASGQPQKPDSDLGVIEQQLSQVKHIILVLSGKGGVGKSTFTSILAHTFAEDEAKSIGVLDIDLCGPSIPRIFGVENEKVHQSGSGWSPVFVQDNLGVVSIGFLLESPDQAVIWRGPRKNGLIKRFLKDVDWGELDYLIIDTPPGTSDEHLSIVQFLKRTNIVGAVIISTPQEISLLDVRKEITFCKKVNIPVLGVVENMSSYKCPKCKVSSQIFVPTTGGAEQMARDMNVPFLGKVPLDSSIGKACDEGKSFLHTVSSSDASKSARTIVQQIISMIEKTIQKEEECELATVV